MRTTYKLLGSEQLIIAFNSYAQAKAYAEKTGLKLAEYGDVYGSAKISYCYWNKTGDRYDLEKVIAYYTWNEQGKPKPISEDQFMAILGI